MYFNGLTKAATNTLWDFSLLLASCRHKEPIIELHGRIAYFYTAFLPKATRIIFNNIKTTGENRLSRLPKKTPSKNK